MPTMNSILSCSSPISCCNGTILYAQSLSILPPIDCLWNVSDIQSSKLQSTLCQKLLMDSLLWYVVFRKTLVWLFRFYFSMKNVEKFFTQTTSRKLTKWPNIRSCESFSAFYRHGLTTFQKCFGKTITSIMEEVFSGQRLEPEEQIKMFL